jgi:hypothetical protein
LFCAVNWYSVKSATEWPGRFLSSATPVGRLWTDASGSFQNSTARTSPAKCQGGDGTNAAAPRGDRGAVNPFSISRPHHQWRINRALLQHETLALVLFPTLGQRCDDLVVCAHPTLTAKQTELRSLAHLLAAPPLWEVEGPQRGRKLQRQTFRYKREPRQECIPICHDDDVGYRLRLWMRVL